MATSTPRPFVMRRISSTGSTFRKSTMWSAPSSRDCQPLRHCVYTDDRCRSGEPRTGRCAEPDRSLREDRHHVSDPHLAALGTAEAGGHDVGAHQDLLVGEAIRHWRKVRHGIWNQDVFRLASVDRIPELPASDRLPAMRRASSVLGVAAGQRCVAMAAWCDGAGDDTLAFLIALDGRSQLFDDPHGS
jgi:hypothetical protein